ncbi:MAG: DUF2865 domain-containing protein [Bauldia sp.]|nr:DUF2865 domain-containing protein [Bauldia sp.]
MRTGLTRVVAALLFLPFGAPALAQTYCDSLRSELAALQQQGGNAANVEFGRLSQQLAGLQQAAEVQGCRRVLRLLNNASCDAIMAQIDATRAQMDAVQRQAFMAGDPNVRARRIAEIQAAIAAANCASTTPQAGRTTTVCVRLCDGYFFPIGYGSSESDYERDARLCQLRCPNQPVELFIRRGGDSPMAEARSVRTGDPYIELANAFLYEANYNADCGCMPADGRVTIAMFGLGERFETRVSTAAVPAAGEAGGPSHPPIGPRRPEPSEDPATVDNRSGALAVVRLELRGPEDGVLVSEAGVRLVGPAFLYAQ